MEKSKKTININISESYFRNNNLTLIQERVVPSLIRKFNREFKIVEISVNFIIKGFYIRINNNLIDAVYLRDCWHPNAVYFPFEFHEQYLLQDEDFFKRPPNLLKCCIPAPLQNMEYREENIQKIIRVIGLWNLSSSYWSNPGIGLLTTEKISYEVEDENCRIENIKSCYHKIYELNKDGDIEIYFNSNESYKNSCDGFLMQKMLKGTITDYLCAVNWFNSLIPIFNIYKIHTISKGRIELVHTKTAITSLILQGKKDGEK